MIAINYIYPTKRRRGRQEVVGEPAIEFFQLNEDGGLGERLTGAVAAQAAYAIRQNDFKVFVGDGDGEPVSIDQPSAQQWLQNLGVNPQIPNANMSDRDLMMWFESYRGDYTGMQLPDQFDPGQAAREARPDEEDEGEDEEAEEVDVLGQEELSPMDELAQKILAGELNPHAFLGPEGQPQVSPAGGALTTAPVPTAPVQAMKSAPVARTGMTEGGYTPMVGDSLLKGVPVAYSPGLVGGADPTVDDITGDGPPTLYDPNKFVPPVSAELIEQYPWLDWSDPNTWSMTVDERERAAKESLFLSKYGDYLGQQYRVPQEEVQINNEDYYNIGYNLLNSGFTAEEVKLVLGAWDEGTQTGIFRPRAAYFLSENDSKWREFIEANPAWMGLADKFKDLPDYAKDPEGTIINPYLGQWEDNEDTPWSDLRNLEENGIVAPPWNINHNPRLDMFGRPLARGGLTWEQFLSINLIDPETGIPYGDADAFTWRAPLTQEMMAPGYGEQIGNYFDMFNVKEQEQEQVQQDRAVPQQVFNPPETTSDQLGATAYLGAPTQEQETQEQGDEPVQQFADALSQAGFDQGSLPPMSYGSGKGSPSQQLMPEQTAPEGYEYGAPSSPLSGALSIPVENLEPPSRRGLFPTTNAFYR